MIHVNSEVLTNFIFSDTFVVKVFVNSYQQYQDYNLIRQTRCKFKLFLPKDIFFLEINLIISWPPAVIVKVLR